MCFITAPHMHHATPLLLLLTPLLLHDTQLQAQVHGTPEAHQLHTMHTLMSSSVLTDVLQNMPPYMRSEAPRYQLKPTGTSQM